MPTIPINPGNPTGPSNTATIYITYGYAANINNALWFIENGRFRYVPPECSNLFTVWPGYATVNGVKTYLNISNSLEFFGQGVPLLPTTFCLKSNSKDDVYLVDQGWRRHITNKDIDNSSLPYPNTINWAANLYTLDDYLVNIIPTTTPSFGGIIGQYPTNTSNPNPPMFAPIQSWPVIAPDSYSPTPAGILMTSPPPDHIFTGLNKYNGYVLKRSTDPAIYMVDQGACRLIPDMTTYNNLYGYNSVHQDPNTLSITIQGVPNNQQGNADPYHCPTNQACATPQSTLPNILSSGACLVTSDNQNYYFVDQCVKRWIPTNNPVFSAYFFSTTLVKHVPSQYITTIPTGNSLLPGSFYGS